MNVQADRLATLAALGEPLRREIYLYVASCPQPVSREQAAERFEVPRGTAAFHLDKLADLRLLEVEYHRPPGRSGPGAGRPAKYYRATGHDVSFSVPAREYELAGRLLAESVTVAQRDGISASAALRAAARKVGRTLGMRAREHAGGRPSREELVGAACEELSDCAYEPRQDADGLTMVNCPFHALAEEYRDLICGMNLELMSGFTEPLEGAGLEARLEPDRGRCCVRLVRSDDPTAPVSRAPR